MGGVHPGHHPCQVHLAEGGLHFWKSDQTVLQGIDETFHQQEVAVHHAFVVSAPSAQVQEAILRTIVGHAQRTYRAVHAPHHIHMFGQEESSPCARAVVVVVAVYAGVVRSVSEYDDSHGGDVHKTKCIEVVACRVWKQLFGPFSFSVPIIIIIIQAHWSNGCMKGKTGRQLQRYKDLVNGSNLRDDTVKSLPQSL